MSELQDAYHNILRFENPDIWRLAKLLDINNNPRRKSPYATSRVFTEEMNSDASISKHDAHLGAVESEPLDETYRAAISLPRFSYGPDGEYL